LLIIVTSTNGLYSKKSGLKLVSNIKIVYGSNLRTIQIMSINLNEIVRHESGCCTVEMSKKQLSVSVPNVCFKTLKKDLKNIFLNNNVINAGKCFVF
jgi:hypothetical protein